FDIDNDAVLDVNKEIVSVGEEGRSPHRARHCAAGSDGETNFGVTSLAAPKAASSSVARYSFMARLAVPGVHVFFHSEPGTDRCVLASATIRLASTAKPRP